MLSRLERRRVYPKDFKVWVGGRVANPAQRTQRYVSRTSPDVQHPHGLKDEGY